MAAWNSSTKLQVKVFELLSQVLAIAPQVALPILTTDASRQAAWEKPFLVTDKSQTYRIFPGDKCSIGISSWSRMQ